MAVRDLGQLRSRELLGPDLGEFPLAKGGGVSRRSATTCQDDASEAAHGPRRRYPRRQSDADESVKDRVSHRSRQRTVARGWLRAREQCSCWLGSTCFTWGPRAVMNDCVEGLLLASEVEANTHARSPKEARHLGVRGRPGPATPAALPGLPQALLARSASVCAVAPAVRVPWRTASSAARRSTPATRPSGKPRGPRPGAGLHRLRHPHRALQGAGGRVLAQGVATGHTVDHPPHHLPLLSRATWSATSSRPSGASPCSNSPAPTSTPSTPSSSRENRKGKNRSSHPPPCAESTPPCTGP